MYLWLSILIGVIVISALVLGVAPVRRQLVSRWLLRIFIKSMPKISRTEKEALESGTVSFEGDFFSGKPNFDKLLSLPGVTLSEEERAFIDGPLEALCHKVNDWDVAHHLHDLPDEVWEFLKQEGFFGLIIPKRYGGKEFSAWALSQVLSKSGSRCIPLAVTIAVPNSLGPGELLVRYGTTEQKNHYLPRLATGEEIPCFALTAPTAGSDASSIPDTGIICRDVFEGKEQIGIRLNWDKRYITLAPKATLIGLAFRLYDPELLLGDKTDLGITCALVPAHLTGIDIGRRHNPSHVAFLNGPTRGRDVFVPLESIIGGPQLAGQGWRMLMECLSAGRAITLPSSAASGNAVVALMTGAYARIREQFNLPLCRFEGIQEPLARIAANAYINTSALRFTVAAIDAGHEPPVASAIIKYHTTERHRQSVNDAMDIHGGKGICIGPNNYLNSAYQLVPINITVEGANILTRNVIIFGQGAIRCHPYILHEIQAAQLQDVVAFDRALFAHLRFILRNKLRAFGFGFVAGRFCSAPHGPVRAYFQSISRLSAAFALAVDTSIIVLGASLKRREHMSARLGDVLSNLYLASATLKRFYDDGKPEEDLPIVHWACRDLISRAEDSLVALCQNMPFRIFGWALRLLIFPIGRCQRAPNDVLTKQVANLLTQSSSTRARLAQGLFLTPLHDNLLYKLEDAFAKVQDSQAIEKRLLAKGKQLGKTLIQLATDAVQKNEISLEELKKVIVANEARAEVIAVDDFDEHDQL